MGAAALPGRTGQRGGDRLHQPGMGIGGDQCDPGQAAGDQVAEESQPPRTGLASGDLDAEDLAVPVGVDAGNVVATKTATLPTRPPSRTFIVNASAATNVYGPASSGRLRNESTCSSRARIAL